MSTKAIEAFSPAGISSFFEICDSSSDGKLITDYERVGARGGGFVIQNGVHTRVEISRTNHTTVEVFIDGKPAPEAETTLTVAEMLLARSKNKVKVKIEHHVEVPIGAGFGSSAGGALGTALALSEAINLKLTYNQLGMIAHIAEIKCKTGLGTVGPIMLGGCILTVEPGGPGIGIIDRLPLAPNHVIVCGTFDPMPTRNFLLASPENREMINRCGKQTLKAILEEPSLENFLARCLEFSERTGFATPRTKRLVRLADKAGAIGAAQNMVGEAVHAVASEANAGSVEDAFRQVLSEERVIAARIDFQGARLLEK